jgi:hypothetical protein
VIGKPFRLTSYDEDGRAELEFTDNSGVAHYIYVSSDLISKIF